MAPSYADASVQKAGANQVQKANAAATAAGMNGQTTGGGAAGPAPATAKPGLIGG